MKLLTRWYRGFQGIELNIKESLILYKTIGKFSKYYALNTLDLTEEEFKILTKIWDQLNEEFDK